MLRCSKFKRKSTSQPDIAEDYKVPLGQGCTLNRYGQESIVGFPAPFADVSIGYMLM